MDYWTECQYYDIVWVCFTFGDCNHCCFCCGHPCTMLGVSLFISCKNKIQCVCVKKKKNNILHRLLLLLLPHEPGSHTACHVSFVSFNMKCFPQSVFIFRDIEIFEEGRPVILQNVPQFEIVCCFLMIKFRLYIPARISHGW